MPAGKTWINMRVRNKGMPSGTIILSPKGIRNQRLIEVMRRMRLIGTSAATAAHEKNNRKNGKLRG
jgi:hypothetical protein